MAKNTEMMIHGAMTNVTVLDSTAEELDFAAFAAKWGHRNLLDNAYWANADSIIDQRGGYVVPPGVDIWKASDPNVRMVTESYIRVESYYPDGNAKFTIDGEDWCTMNQPGDSRIVRGYTGGGYGLDRWLTINPKTVVLIVDGCLTFYGYENYANFEQKIGSIKSFAGKTMTLSVLRRETNADTIVGFLYDGGFSQCGVSTSELISHTFTVPEVESGNLDVFIQHMGADSIDNPHNLIAAKLEFGDHQTLARQDDTGKWMLIDPPPNKALELVTCQRTFVNLATNVYSTVGCGFIESNGDTALLIIPLPATLRTVPGITLTGTMGIVCNGETRSVNPDSITLMNVGASSICVMFGLIGNMPAGESCYGYLDPGSKLLLTAEP